LREFELKRGTKSIWTCITNFPIRNGDLDVLKYAFESCQHQYISSEIIQLAVFYEHLHILDYLVEKWGKDTLVHNVTTSAACDGEASIIKYFNETYYLDDNVFYLAAKYGQLNIVQYLHESDYECDEDELKKVIKVARHYRRRHILEFIYQNWDCPECLE
jgi:hypothetical protein